MDTTAVRCQQDHLFSSQTYRIFESDLLSFDLVLPIYWLSPSHCWVGPNLGLTQSFSFFLSRIFSLLTQSITFTESVLPIFFTASFPLFPALRFDLIAMYTVDKINDGGMCRKRLPHYLEWKIESLARESDQENTKRQE